MPLIALLLVLIAAPDAPRLPWAAEIKAAVAGYATPQGLVATEPDRAPTDCMAPSFGVEPKKSAAMTTDDGHGKKLYFLYARDVTAYRMMTGLHNDWRFGYGDAKTAKPPERVTTQPVGQLIVKESWTDVLVPEGAPRPPKPDGLPNMAQVHTRVDDGEHYIGQRSALFAMMKVAATAVPDTDEGWVYATLTPDGATVTASGRIASCMGCHTRAPHDRLFGPKR